MEEIKKEEADYENYPLPKFYKFTSKDARERILYKNFTRINDDVQEMIKAVQTEFPHPREPKDTNGKKG